jgi:ketosteroid isomerase-like protein
MDLFKMKRFIIFSGLLFLSGPPGFAQVSNGRVNSLVAAENYFAATVQEKGIRAGYLRVSDKETIVFRPEPVKARDLYTPPQKDVGMLSWEPSFAKTSKSGDWGFTTGPYKYISYKDDSEAYGQYLSVWKANHKGVWKLAISLATPHPKPLTEPGMEFTDPKDFRFFRQISEARIQQRLDMIMTSDKLLSTTLRKNTAIAYTTFLGNEARLIFPGYEPVKGKESILEFFDKNKFYIDAEAAVADRAAGSDFAFTYGVAHISQEEKTGKYNYIRIWESQEEGQWNVIVEMFSPAE